MATLWELYNKYSQLDIKRTVYLKRCIDGVNYETDWIEAPNMDTQREGCIGDISMKLPEKGLELGAVVMSNCEFEFNNFYGEWSDETNRKSIFYGYQRHDSKIKIVDSYYDKEINESVHLTDAFGTQLDDAIGLDLSYQVYSNTGEWISIDTAEFLIDDRQAVTTLNDTERFVGVDMTTLLKNYRIKEFTLVSTTISTVVYEILNRIEFTAYFTVSAGNILPAVNSSSLDMTKYADDTVFDCLADLCKGHSISQIKAGVFYLNPVTPTTAVQYEFLDSPQRKINLDVASNGSENVIEKLFWNSSTETYTASTQKYKTSETFDIKGVTDPTQRQTMLSYIGMMNSDKRPVYAFSVPLLPTVQLLDKIKIVFQGYIENGVFMIGMSKLGSTDVLGTPVGAFNIKYSESFMVREILHSDSTTKITIEKI